MTDNVAAISKVTFFASLLPDEKIALSKKIKEQAYSKGEAVFKKGDVGSRLYIIKKGRVKIVLPSEDGREAIIAILSNGDFFGELSLFDGKPRSASAIAIDNTEVLTIHRNHFLQFIQESPHILSDILSVVGSRLRHADNLVEDASFLDMPARLAKRILDLAEEHGIKTDSGIQIDMELTQQDIANMVGATRESINKQLRLCQERGVLKIENQRLIILKPKELQKRIY